MHKHRKVGLAVSALWVGVPMAWPDGRTWLYRLRGQKAGNEPAVVEGLYEVSPDQCGTLVRAPFAYVVEALAGMPDEQIAVMAAGLAEYESRLGEG